MPVMQKINDNLIRRFCRILRHMSGVMSVLYIYIYKSAARRFFSAPYFYCFSALSPHCKLFAVSAVPVS